MTAMLVITAGNYNYDCDVASKYYSSDAKFHENPSISSNIRSHLNNMCKFYSYQTENTPCLHYKHQQVNNVQGNND